MHQKNLQLLAIRNASANEAAKQVCSLPTTTLDGSSLVVKGGMFVVQCLARP